MSSSFERESPSDARRADARPASGGTRAGGIRGSDPAFGRELLESVLRQTASEPAPEDAPTPADWDALRELAGRHRGRPFVLEPIGVELVNAVLHQRYRPLAVDDHAWQKLTNRIAHTLFDDPVSRDRLEAMWLRIRERFP